MKFIKELWSLAKMLFGAKPSKVISRGRIKYIPMKYFPCGENDFMMWCGRIIIRKGGDSDIVTKRVLNHEMIHMYQAIYNCKDSWPRYYWSYFVNWLKHNPLTYPSSACYLLNKYEVEAYANESNMGYLFDYTTENVNGKYNIKHAKKIFKRMGCNKAEWFHFIKSL